MIGVGSVRRAACLLTVISAPWSAMRAQEPGQARALVAVVSRMPSLAEAAGPMGVSPRGWAHDLGLRVPLGGPGLRRADLWKLGGLAALAGVVATADRRGDAWARRESVQGSDALRVLSEIGDAAGSYGAIGIGPATWLLGRVRGDSGTAVMGLRTTEAVAISGVTIGVIKAIAGRSRPYASAGNSPTHWDLFGGLRSDSTRSFASGHSALSAAAAVTLAAEWRRQGARGWKTVGPPLVHALAGVTAGSRVRDRQHWLSDVVTGAGVGMLSALVVRRWHDVHPNSRLDRTFLAR
jgi:membrane-associated phospholipid phosphatase